MMEAPFNQHGGLTIVPMPGFEGMADDIKRLIETDTNGSSDKKRTPVDIAVPEFRQHVNKEPDPRLDKRHVGDHDCVVLASGPGTYEMMGKLLLLISLLCGRRASRICVIFGYSPLSRSDKDEGDQVLAWPAWLVQQIVMAANGKLDRIIVVDPHSPQLVMAGRQGLITPVTMMRRVFKAALIQAKAVYPLHQVCVYYPDDGAAKQYERPIEAVIAEESGLSVGLIFGTKRRINSGASAPLHLTGDITRIRGALVICVDDEGATLGTQLGVAVKVKNDHGASTFWSAFVHGVLCGDALQKISAQDCPIDRLIITDSIPQPPEVQECQRVSIVSIVRDLAHMIYCHHWGENIREQR